MIGTRDPAWQRGIRTRTTNPTQPKSTRPASRVGQHPPPPGGGERTAHAISNDSSVVVRLFWVPMAAVHRRWLPYICRGMARTARLELRVDPGLLARVDAARGDVPRSRWVERALEAMLDGSAEGAPVGGDAIRGVGPEKAPRSSGRVSASPRASGRPDDARAWALERQRKMNESKGF